jgi:gp16 family phage-associated protein
MDKEQRKKTVQHKLVDMGETVTSWANKNGLHQRIVADLIDGKLKGTRGVALETRRRMEEAFGNLFDEKETTQRNP